MVNKSIKVVDITPLESVNEEVNDEIISPLPEEEQVEDVKEEEEAEPAIEDEPVPPQVEEAKPKGKKKGPLPELERKAHVIEKVICPDCNRSMTAKQLKYSHPRYCKAKQDNDNIIENKIENNKIVNNKPVAGGIKPPHKPPPKPKPEANPSPDINPATAGNPFTMDYTTRQRYYQEMMQQRQVVKQQKLDKLFSKVW